MTIRWNKIVAIWKDNRWLYIVSGLLLGILIAPAIQQITGNLNTLMGNLVPEAIGIVFTVLFLNRAADNRAYEQHKQDLIRRAGSTVSAVAVDAIDQLRKEGLLTGANGILKRQNLYGANLQNANLNDANLEGVNLEKANLAKAKMVRANLKDADLVGCNLYDAYMVEANLEGVKLYYTDFRSANLSRANLQGADIDYALLGGAILYEANLRNVKSDHLDNDVSGSVIFDKATILPDGTEIPYTSYDYPEYTEFEDGRWTPNTNMYRYTDPTNKDINGNSDFWQPSYLSRVYKYGRPFWVTDDMLTD